MTESEKNLAVIAILCEAKRAREKQVGKKIKFEEVCKTCQVTDDERAEWKAIIEHYEYLSRFYDELAAKVETILNSQTTDPETV